MQNAHIRAILRAPQRTRPSFFDDPDGHFLAVGGSDAALKEMIGKISRRTRRRVVAALFNGNLYIPEYFWKNGHWIHRYGVEKMFHADGRLSTHVELRTCPVPGRQNLFSYSGSNDRFITGCSRPAQAVANDVPFSRIAGLSGFKKIDSFLAYVISYVYSKVVQRGNRILLAEIAPNGTSIQFSTDDADFISDTVIAIMAAKYGFGCVLVAAPPPMFRYILWV